MTTPLKARGMLKSTDNGAFHPLKIEEVISNRLLYLVLCGAQ